MGAAAERPDNMVKDFKQWQLAAMSDVTFGGDPNAVFSEAYRLEVNGQLNRALILYQEIRNEPALRLAVAERIRSVEAELQRKYVDQHGVVNKGLLTNLNVYRQLQEYVRRVMQPTLMGGPAGGGSDGLSIGGIIISW